MRGGGPYKSALTQLRCEPQEAATQTLAAQFKADPAKPTTAGFKTNDSYM